MNTQVVTTGLIPLISGSVELFVAKPFIDYLPWINIGSAKVVFQDPLGQLTHYSASISANGITLQWAVPTGAGTWLRQWVFTDTNGVHQVSQKIVFVVENALDPSVF